MQDAGIKPGLVESLFFFFFFFSSCDRSRRGASVLPLSTFLSDSGAWYFRGVKALYVLLAVFVMLFASCAQPIQPELEVTPETDTLETNRPVKLTVTRRYTGGAVRDVTNVVTYSSSDETVAKVSREGLLSGVNTGQATIRVVDTGTHASVAFTVDVVAPANQRIVQIDVVPGILVLPPASTRQLEAQARYADDSVGDVTTQVQWATDHADVAIVGTTDFDKGVVRSITNGRTRITATHQSRVQGSAELIVEGSATALQVVVVAPNPAGPLAPAGTLQFTATGFFANGTTADVTNGVTWQSSVQSVATVSTSGLVTAAAQGDTTISAIAPSGPRGSAALKVQ